MMHVVLVPHTTDMMPVVLVPPPTEMMPVVLVSPARRSNQPAQTLSPTTEMMQVVLVPHTTEMMLVVLVPPPTEMMPVVPSPPQTVPLPARPARPTAVPVLPCSGPPRSVFSGPPRTMAPTTRPLILTQALVPPPTHVMPVVLVPSPSQTVLLAARPAHATMVSSEESKMSVLMPMWAARAAMYLTHRLRQRTHQLWRTHQPLHRWPHPMMGSPILLVVASSEMSPLILMSDADPHIPDHHRTHRLHRRTHQPW
jgi:hypothetical protein